MANYSCEWSYAFGKPQGNSLLKQTPEDFQVHEFFTQPFSGEGEHILVKVEKKGLTTEEVIKSLARLINKPQRMISYAGLKDKQALSTQWLSIHAPGEDIANLDSLCGPNWRILEHTRHQKKLRPGYLTGNQFILKLREVSEADELLERLDIIQKTGVPNYFGEQRFGRDRNNLIHAEQLLVQRKNIKDRFLKSIYFSAARSWLFNLILSQRVFTGNWNTPMPGDIIQLDGSNSIFTVDTIDETLIARVNSGDISPASPLAGKSKEITKNAMLETIDTVYEQWQAWIEGLIHYGLDEAWRPNILRAREVSYQRVGNDVQLQFTLPAGAYATTLIRELSNITLPHHGAI